MVEFLSRGEIYSTLAVLAVLLAWSMAMARVIWIDRDYHSAPAGGWLVLGGMMAICLAEATMVPLHTSVLMTVYAGLGPALLLIMGMAGLLVLDGMAAWLNPPTPRPHRRHASCAARLTPPHNSRRGSGHASRQSPADARSLGTTLIAASPLITMPT